MIREIDVDAIIEQNDRFLKWHAEQGQTITKLREQKKSLEDAIVQASIDMTRAFVDDIPNDLDGIVSYVERLRNAILKVNQSFAEVMKENIQL